MLRLQLIFCLIIRLASAQSINIIDQEFSGVNNNKIVPFHSRDSIPEFFLNKELNKAMGIRTFDYKTNRPKEWTGTTLANSISAICVTNTCGYGGGGGAGADFILYPPTITASSSIVCTNSYPLSVTLEATGCRANERVKWYRDNDIPIGSASISRIKTINPSAPLTTYFATCTSPNNTEVESRRSNTKTITKIQTLPTPIASTFPSVILAGNYATLNGQGCPAGTNYSWTGLGIGDNVVVSPQVNTTYTVKCKQSDCVGSSATVTVTTLQPTVISSGDSVCYDNATQSSNEVTLTLSNCNSSIIWSTGDTTQSITVQPSSPTIYYASCYAQAGNYIFSNFKNIQASNAPIITKVPGTNNDFILSTECNSGSTILWNTGASTNSISVPNNLSMEYSVQCKLNQCFSKPSKIKINAAPDISANIKTICQGQTLVLTATECSGVIEWFRAINSTTVFNSAGTGNPHTYTVPVNQSTTKMFYKATCTDGSTSDFSNIINIGVQNGTIPPSPTITTTPNSAVINLGNTIQLTATGCGTFATKWTTGDLTATITKTPLTTTIYTAYCQNTCPSELVNKEVKVFNIEPPTISSQTTKICAGGILTLNSTTCVGDLKWYSVPQSNPTAILTYRGNNNPLVLTINESFIYKATCDKNGATSYFSNELVVNFSNKPSVLNAADNDTFYGAIYENQSLELIASGCAPGDTYLWSTNETSPNIFVTPTVSGSYIAKCTNDVCTTNGKSYFVKVCPAVQYFKSPTDDHNSTPFSQPEPAGAIVASNLIQNSGTQVDYRALESIILNPGFSANNGTTFAAQIGGCKIPSDTN